MKRGFLFASGLNTQRAGGDAAPTGTTSLSVLSDVKQSPTRMSLQGLYVVRMKKEPSAPSTPTQVVLGVLGQQLPEHAPLVPVHDGAGESVPAYTWLDAGRTAIMINVYEYNTAERAKAKESPQAYKFAEGRGVVLRSGDCVRLGVDKSVPDRGFVPCTLYNVRFRIVPSKDGLQPAALYMQASDVLRSNGEYAGRPLEEVVCGILPYEQQLMPALHGATSEPTAAIERAASGTPVPATDFTHGQGVKRFWADRVVRLSINSTLRGFRPHGSDAQSDNCWALPEESLLYSPDTTSSAAQVTALEYWETALCKTRQQGQTLARADLHSTFTAKHMQLDSAGVAQTTALKGEVIWHDAFMSTGLRFAPLTERILVPPAVTGLPPVPVHLLFQPDLDKSRADPINDPRAASERASYGISQRVIGRTVAVVARLAEYLTRYGVPVTPEFVGRRYSVARNYTHEQMGARVPAEGWTYDQWVSDPLASSKVDVVASGLARPLGFDNHVGAVALDGADKATLNLITSHVEEDEAAATPSQGEGAERRQRRPLPWRFFALPISERLIAANGCALAVPLVEDAAHVAMFRENDVDVSRAPRRVAIVAPAEGDAYVQRLLEANLQTRDALKRRFPTLVAALKDREGGVWMQDTEAVPGEATPAWKVTLPIVLFFAVPAHYEPAAPDSYTQPSVLIEPPAKKARREPVPPVPAPDPAAGSPVAGEEEDLFDD